MFAYYIHTVNTSSDRKLSVTCYFTNVSLRYRFIFIVLDNKFEFVDETKVKKKKKIWKTDNFNR